MNSTGRSLVEHNDSTDVRSWNVFRWKYKGRAIRWTTTTSVVGLTHDDRYGLSDR
jgi:hypothetical protein